MRSFSRCWLPNEDCQVWLRCERKLWSENNSTYLWLYLNQQGALVKEIFRNSELLEFCHLERYEWCYVNFCIPLFSILLTRRNCNSGALFFRHWWNKRNIRMVSVRVYLTYYSLALFLLIQGSCMQSSQFWFDVKLGSL